MTRSSPISNPEAALTVETVAHRLEDAAPQDVLAWALEHYRSRIVLACSFGGPTGIVALDMVLRIDPATPVYYLDTGLLFTQTYELVAKVAQRYGIEPIGVRPRYTVEEQRALFGDALWKRDPDACCAIRKVEPQREFLFGYDAWISGLRRDQAPTRRAVAVADWDRKFGLVKINPFARWDEAAIWRYVRAHDLPYNDLHDRGFPSVGCSPCTRAAEAGAGARSGRWPGRVKTECGLHAGPVLVSVGGAR
jgi:phosphoadenosine phosphosulfate reductase